MYVCMNVFSYKKFKIIKRKKRSLKSPKEENKCKKQGYNNNNK